MKPIAESSIRARALAVLVACLGLGACAAAQSGETGALLYDGRVEPLVSLLTVTNNHSQGVEIFAVPEDTGTPYRLGVVRAGLSKTFKLSALEHRAMHLTVRPVRQVSGTQQSFNTSAFSVWEGGEVELLISSILGHHTLRVY